MRQTRRSGMHPVFKVMIALLLIFILIVGGLIAYVYFQIRSTANDMYDAEFEGSQSNLREAQVELSEGEPVSVVLFGTDDDEARNEVMMGQRSDTIMVVTLNPDSGEGRIVSIPRDTQAEIIGRDTVEKINHSYAYGGPIMAKDTVENFLDVPLDYFVSINMDGFKNIIDEVGGVSVTSSDTFDQSGYTFVEGETYEMDGDMALAFSRARYDPGSGGDAGRQQRQQQVVQAIANELLSLQTVTNFNAILDVLGENIRTNIQFGEMNELRSTYQEPAQNMEQLLLEGYDERSTDDGLYYFYPYEESYEAVTNELKENLEIE